jgi:hypothetical protein
MPIRTYLRNIKIQRGGRHHLRELLKIMLEEVGIKVGLKTMELPE